jgi:hypothetical protein
MNSETRAEWTIVGKELLINPLKVSDRCETVRTLTPIAGLIRTKTKNGTHEFIIVIFPHPFLLPFAKADKKWTPLLLP